MDEARDKYASEQLANLMAWIGNLFRPKGIRRVNASDFLRKKKRKQSRSDVIKVDLGVLKTVFVGGDLPPPKDAASQEGPQS